MVSQWRLFNDQQLTYYYSPHLRAFFRFGAMIHKDLN